MIQGNNKAKKPANKGKRLIYNIITLILIGVIIYSVYNLASIGYGYWKARNAYSSLEEVAGVTAGLNFKVDWEKLKEKNPDIKGWIYLKDSPINYPIVQGKDNDYYLTHMADKQWSGNGAIFLDYRHENPFEDFLTIIYGHRMRDGSMFHDIIKYRDEDYYKKHKEFLISTPEKKYKLKVIGAVTLPADSPQYKFSFNGVEKENYINWIRENSEVKTDPIDVNADDKIVMLSTCTYEFDDARLVVFGKLEEIAE